MFIWNKIVRNSKFSMNRKNVSNGSILSFHNRELTESHPWNDRIIYVS